MRYDRRISHRVHFNRFSRPCKYSCLPKSHLLSDTKYVKNDEKNAQKTPPHRKTGVNSEKRGDKCKMQNAKLWMSDGRARRKGDTFFRRGGVSPPVFTLQSNVFGRGDPSPTVSIGRETADPRSSAQQHRAKATVESRALLIQASPQKKKP